jgi:hypothetical protein
MNIMRRIIQRTITTINITSFTYVEETASIRTTPAESTSDCLPGHQPLIPIEQPSDDGQPAIQT